MAAEGEKPEAAADAGKVEEEKKDEEDKGAKPN